MTPRACYRFGGASQNVAMASGRFGTTLGYHALALGTPGNGAEAGTTAMGGHDGKPLDEIIRRRAFAAGRGHDSGTGLDLPAVRDFQLF